MLEVRETSPTGDWRYGHAVVGATPVQVTPNSIQLVRGVLLRCPGPNDLVPNVDVVYIGFAGVTATGTPGSDSDGLPLLPGSAIELPVDDPSLIWAVSNTPGQDISWTGI